MSIFERTYGWGIIYHTIGCLYIYLLSPRSWIQYLFEWNLSFNSNSIIPTGKRSAKSLRLVPSLNREWRGGGRKSRQRYQNGLKRKIPVIPNRRHRHPPTDLVERRTINSEDVLREERKTTRDSPVKNLSRKRKSHSVKLKAWTCVQSRKAITTTDLCVVTIVSCWSLLAFSRKILLLMRTTKTPCDSYWTIMAAPNNSGWGLNLQRQGGFYKDPDWWIGQGDSISVISSSQWCSQQW